MKWMEMADKAIQDFRKSLKGSSVGNLRGINYEAVLKLIDIGVSQTDISRITGVGEGEIDLIRKLKRKA